MITKKQRQDKKKINLELRQIENSIRYEMNQLTVNKNYV